MQIPQVTAQSALAEPKAAEGDQQSTKGGGEQGAFAILLALLQGSVAPAQSGLVSDGTVPTDGEQAASLIAANGAAQAETAGVTASVSPILVGPGAETTAVTTAEPAQVTPAEPKDAAGPSVSTGTTTASAPAKLLVLTEVATPVDAGKSAQTSSAQFVVERANAERSEHGGTVNPASSAAPKTAAPSTPVAETGIPVTALAGDEASDSDLGTKLTATADDAIEPEVQGGAPRSTARFVVAKPGATEVESPNLKTESAQKLAQSAAQAGSSTTDEVAKPHSESADLRKAVEHGLARNAGTSASHSDGVRPVNAEVTQTAPVQVDSTVRGTERAKPETEQAAVPDRTTVKTIVIDTVRGVRYLLTKGEQTMRIRLVPESLGEMRLVVTSSSDEISVRIASASHTVRELMHTQIQHLREALSQDGANVGKITISADMSAGTGTGNPQMGSADRAWNPNAREWTGSTASPPKYPSAMGQQLGVVPRQTVPHTGALNLFA